MLDLARIPFDLLVSMFAAKFRLSRMRIAQSMFEAALVALSVENGCCLDPDQIVSLVESTFGDRFNGHGQLRALVCKEIKKRSLERAVDHVAADILLQAIKLGFGNDRPNADQIEEMKDFVAAVVIYVRQRSILKGL